MKNQFFHAGAAGDVIYSLPTIKEMGGGELVCGFKYDLYSSLKPLLMTADFITGVYHVSERDLSSGWVNLDLFRHYQHVSKDHLVNSHLVMQQLNPVIPDKWIYNVPANGDSTLPKHYSVINRSARHRDKLFNWNKELKFLRMFGSVYFLGHREEHDDFERRFGERITYIHTKDHLDAARIIAGADMFSGNQSSLLAIRQGLGLPYRMEKSPFHSNCTTRRKNERIINPITNKLHYFISRLKSI